MYERYRQCVARFQVYAAALHFEYICNGNSCCPGGPGSRDTDAILNYSITVARQSLSRDQFVPRAVRPSRPVCYPLNRQHRDRVHRDRGLTSATKCDRPVYINEQIHTRCYADTALRRINEQVQPRQIFQEYPVTRSN